MRVFAEVITVLSVLSISAYGGSIPNYIQICKRSNVDLNSCIKNSILNLRPNLAKGLPELHVPAMEPFFLDRIVLDRNIPTNLTEVNAYGVTNFEIKEFKAEVEKNRYAFVLFLPKFNMKGIYEVDTKLSLLTLKGSGPFYADLSDFNVLGSIKGRKFKKNGVTYLKFDDLKLDVVPGKTIIKLENLFNGNKQLGDTANQVINDNVELFLEGIIPMFVQQLTKKFLEIANSITGTFTYDELFPLN